MNRDSDISLKTFVRLQTDELLQFYAQWECRYNGLTLTLPATEWQTRFEAFLRMYDGYNTEDIAQLTRDPEKDQP